MVGHPQSLGGLARLPENVDWNTAPGVPISTYAQPMWLHFLKQPLTDTHGAILMKGRVISERSEKQLKGF